MSWIFLSYQRNNEVYATKLADALMRYGFNVWIDKRINPGENWEEEIMKAVAGCSAFIVLMTPSAGQSEWVQRECQWARTLKKPEFPLLFTGNHFPMYDKVQYETIVGVQLPSENFFEVLGKYVPKGRGKNEYFDAQKRIEAKQQLKNVQSYFKDGKSYDRFEIGGWQYNEVLNYLRHAFELDGSLRHNPDILNFAKDALQQANADKAVELIECDHSEYEYRRKYLLYDFDRFRFMSLWMGNAATVSHGSYARGFFETTWYIIMLVFVFVLIIPVSLINGWIGVYEFAPSTIRRIKIFDKYHIYNEGLFFAHSMMWSSLVAIPLIFSWFSLDILNEWLAITWIFCGCWYISFRSGYWIVEGSSRISHGILWVTAFYVVYVILQSNFYLLVISLLYINISCGIALWLVALTDAIYDGKLTGYPAGYFIFFIFPIVCIMHFFLELYLVGVTDLRFLIWLLLPIPGIAMFRLLDHFSDYPSVINHRPNMEPRKAWQALENSAKKNSTTT